MPTPEWIYLIVNADDFGFYPGISRGILEAARSGVISATSILPNSLGLQEQLTWLDTVEGLDLGVHLNLTYGYPLTAEITKKLSKYAGRFPSVYKLMLMLLTGQISREEIRTEWRAQIEACQGPGRKLIFLNSHEHIHMLPWLFSLAQELAKEFGIPHIRLTRAEWLGSFAMSTLVRNTLIQSMYAINSRSICPEPIFLGLGQSGKLNYTYLREIFSGLKPGKTYELMCHPGYFNANEITDEKLKAYHDWSGELRLFKSAELLGLYERFGIRLSNYQH